MLNANKAIEDFFKTTKTPSSSEETEMLKTLKDGEQRCKEIKKLIKTGKAYISCRNRSFGEHL